MTDQTGEVRLRSLVIEDTETIARLLNNRKIWDNLRDYIPFPYHKKDAKTFIVSSLSQSPKTTFGISYQKKLCGIIGLMLQKDIYRLSAEVGYWIGEPFWGKGIATRAVDLITRYGFSELGLQRIFANTFEHNKASQQVLEKCGYSLEGIAKNAAIKNDLIIDEHKYAIIKSDYPE